MALAWNLARLTLATPLARVRAGQLCPGSTGAVDSGAPTWFVPKTFGFGIAGFPARR